MTCAFSQDWALSTPTAPTQLSAFRRGPSHYLATPQPKTPTAMVVGPASRRPIRPFPVRRSPPRSLTTLKPRVAHSQLQCLCASALNCDVHHSSFIIHQTPRYSCTTTVISSYQSRDPGRPMERSPVQPLRMVSNGAPRTLWTRPPSRQPVISNHRLDGPRS